MVIPFPAPHDEPPPETPAARRNYPEDVPKVADNLIELRSLRMGLRRLDRYRLALDTRRVALEERIDRAEMRLVEVVRHLEMKKSA
jgi:hypothetical protein